MTDGAVGGFLEAILRDGSLSEEVVGRALWLVPFVRTVSVVNEVKVLLRSRPELALAAGNTLGQLADRALAPSLAETLLDPTVSAESRAGAAYALGAIGDVSTKSALVKALRTAGQQPIVLDRVAEALGYLHEEARDAVDDLCALLTADSPEVRYAALCALGNINATEALERVEHLIDDNSVSKYGHVGETAIRVAEAFRAPRQ